MGSKQNIIKRNEIKRYYQSILYFKNTNFDYVISEFVGEGVCVLYKGIIKGFDFYIKNQIVIKNNHIFEKYKYIYDKKDNLISIFERDVCVYHAVYEENKKLYEYDYWENSINLYIYSKDKLLMKTNKKNNSFKDYDSNGNLTYIFGNGHISKMKYDKNNNVVEYKNSAGKVWKNE